MSGTVIAVGGLSADHDDSPLRHVPVSSPVWHLGSRTVLRSPCATVVEPSIVEPAEAHERALRPVERVRPPAAPDAGPEPSAGAGQPFQTVTVTPCGRAAAEAGGSTAVPAVRWSRVRA